jgi:hypothetical protein
MDEISASARFSRKLQMMMAVVEVKTLLSYTTRNFMAIDTCATIE